MDNNNDDYFKQLNYNKILLPLEAFALLVNKTTESRIDTTINVHGNLIT
ncbi:MAG: hypothetical protein ACPKQO_03615 [Nitrososphaeraceae archaeon]